MGFKTALDRYLTAAPDDGLEDWIEMVVDKFSNDFYLKHEGDIDSDKFNDLYMKYQDKDPEEVARLIENEII